MITTALPSWRLATLRAPLLRSTLLHGVLPQSALLGDAWLMSLFTASHGSQLRPGTRGRPVALAGHRTGDTPS